MLPICLKPNDVLLSSFHFHRPGIFLPSYIPRCLIYVLLCYFALDRVIALTQNAIANANVIIFSQRLINISQEHDTYTGVP